MDTFTREFALHLACEDAKREVAEGFAKLRHRLWLLNLTIPAPVDFVDKMMAQQPLSQAALSDMYNSLGNKFGGSSGACNNQTNAPLQQLHEQQQACNNVFYRGYSEPPYSFYGSLGAQGLARVFW